MTKSDNVCRGLARLFTKGKLKGGDSKFIRPKPVDMQRIEKGCRIMTTADLVRFTATGNTNGTVTDTLNELMGQLGERCRPCCIWTLAVVEKDMELRDGIGGILTSALRTEQRKKGGGR